MSPVPGVVYQYDREFSLTPGDTEWVSVCELALGRLDRREGPLEISWTGGTRIRLDVVHSDELDELHLVVIAEPSDPQKKREFREQHARVVRLNRYESRGLVCGWRSVDGTVELVVTPGRREFRALLAAVKRGDLPLAQQLADNWATQSKTAPAMFAHALLQFKIERFSDSMKIAQSGLEVHAEHPGIGYFRKLVDLIESIWDPLCPKPSSFTQGGADSESCARTNAAPVGSPSTNAHTEASRKFWSGLRGLVTN